MAFLGGLPVLLDKRGVVCPELPGLPESLPESLPEFVIASSSVSEAGNSTILLKCL